MQINNKEVSIKDFKLKVKHYFALNKKGIDYFKFIEKLQKFTETNNMSDFPGNDVIAFLGVILSIECGITETDLYELDFDEISKVLALIFPTDSNAGETEQGE